MPSKRDLIRNRAVELLKVHSEGLRYSDLHRELEKSFPDTPPNTISGSMWNLHISKTKEVYKPTRGLFKYRFSPEEQAEEPPAQTRTETGTTFREDGLL